MSDELPSNARSTIEELLQSIFQKAGQAGLDGVRSALAACNSIPPNALAPADAAPDGKRFLVYVHGICTHAAGYSNSWWQAFQQYTAVFGAGTLGATRREVLWSDVIGAHSLNRAALLAGGPVTNVPSDALARLDLASRIRGAIEQRAAEHAATVGPTILATGPAGPWPISLSGPAPGGFSIPMATCIDDFTAYMVNSDVRARVRQRFTDVMTQLTRLADQIDLISHSWGTVVAYEGLRQLEDRGWKTPVVGNFFTVGAALAIEPVKWSLLPQNKDGRKPAMVQRWINLNAHGDPVGGDIQGHPFQVDAQFLELPTLGCGFLDFPCAHNSYFRSDNVQVNRDIFARFINEPLAASRPAIQPPAAATARMPIKATGQQIETEQRDEGGPLQWLGPVIESAYTSLVPRSPRWPNAAPHDAPPRAGVASASMVQPGGQALLASVPRSTWRDLLEQYRRRSAAAPAPAARDAVPAAPIIPGGRNWLPLGPSVVLHGQTQGNQPVAGRVCQLAIAPGGQVVYAASANGGVFRSQDGGTTWKALMDGFGSDPTNYASDSLACGAIALDPAKPDRVFVGTGEGDTYALFSSRVTGALPSYRGVGPIRTEDGGASWKPEPSTPDLAGEAFFAMAIDPTNSERVLAATTAGLYMRTSSADGSFQWIRQRPGVHSGLLAIQSTPSAPMFIAAEWGVGVFQSTDGATWSPLGTGFPSAGIGRIALAAQSGNPNLLYAFVATGDGAVQGLYRFDTAGGTWKPVANLPAVLPGSQGSYDLAIAVDPLDVDTVYLAGDRTDSPPYPGSIWRCKLQDSGAGYQVTAATSIGESAHADVHCLIHTPGDPNELWCGCDGGVFLNRDPRGNGQFASQNNGLACLCANFFAQHPTDPNVLFTGLQDNGTARTDSGPLWTHVNGGDGGYCLIHWANPDLVLVYANGTVYRSTTGGKSEDAWSQSWNFPWATMTEPIVGTPYDPTRTADADTVAVGAGSQIYVSDDFAASWAMNFSLPSDAGNVFALRLASTTRLFIGTTLGQVFRADRSSNSWTLTRLDNAPAGPLGLVGLITDVAIDWADASLASVYVAFGGRGDRRRVWRFDGQKWAARSGPDTGNNLLDVEHNAIAVDRKAPNNVYVGADLGVWHSADAGGNWTPLRNGLPEAAVFDVQVHPTQRLLRAATYGRGLYEIALD